MAHPPSGPQSAAANRPQHTYPTPPVLAYSPLKHAAVTVLSGVGTLVGAVLLGTVTFNPVTASCVFTGTALLGLFTILGGYLPVRRWNLDQVQNFSLHNLGPRTGFYLHVGTTGKAQIIYLSLFDRIRKALGNPMYAKMYSSTQNAGAAIEQEASRRADLAKQHYTPAPLCLTERAVRELSLWNIQPLDLPSFSAEMASDFRKNGVWNLQRLYQQLKADFGRGFHLEYKGKLVSDLATLLRELKIDSLFTQTTTNESELKPNQITALELLAMLHQGTFTAILRVTERCYDIQQAGLSGKNATPDQRAAIAFLQGNDHSAAALAALSPTAQDYIYNAKHLLDPAISDSLFGADYRPSHSFSPFPTSFQILDGTSENTFRISAKQQLYMRRTADDGVDKAVFPEAVGDIFIYSDGSARGSLLMTPQSQIH